MCQRQVQKAKADIIKHRKVHSRDAEKRDHHGRYALLKIYGLNSLLKGESEASEWMSLGNPFHKGLSIIGKAIEVIYLQCREKNTHTKTIEIEK